MPPTVMSPTTEGSSSDDDEETIGIAVGISAGVAVLILVAVIVVIIIIYKARSDGKYVLPYTTTVFGEHFMYTCDYISVLAIHRSCYIIMHGGYTIPLQAIKLQVVIKCLQYLMIMWTAQEI